ncbi:hypothetical protein IV102_17610 [bacterium]|nr:hypothetical protein [bacterium]
MVRPFGQREDNCASRLRLALTMMGAGIEMMRMNLQRKYPDESEQQIEHRLTHWLEYQPHSADYCCAMHRLRHRA